MSDKSLRDEVIEECAKVADRAAQSDVDYAAKYPDEAVKFHQRAHRARTIATSIRDMLVSCGEGMTNG